MANSSSNKTEELAESINAQNEEYTKLIASLKGETVTVPDLRPIFSGWPCGNNANQASLVKMMVKWMISLLPWKYLTSQRFLTYDVPSFCAMWWPRAELQELYILTCFIGWLFLWHDTVDEPLGARVYDSRARANYNRDHSKNSRAGAQNSRDHAVNSHDYAEYGKDTKEFLRHCLQVISHDKITKPRSIKEGIKTLWTNISTGRGLNNHYAVPKKLNSIIHQFEGIGDQIRAVYTIEQRTTLLAEINKYIDATLEMQMYRTSHIVTSVNTYWDMRMGSSGCGIVSTLIDLANKIHVPLAITEDGDIQILVNETNRIISMTNDLLSLQEFSQGNTSYIMNHVLLAFAEQEHKNIQLVIEQAVDFIKAAVERFDSTAAWILSGPRDDLTSRAHRRAFIQGCRENCTGNLEWSLATGRYGLKDALQADGSLSLIL